MEPHRNKDKGVGVDLIRTPSVQLQTKESRILSRVVYHLTISKVSKDDTETLRVLC